MIMAIWFRMDEGDRRLLRVYLILLPYVASFLGHYWLRLPPLRSGLGILGYLAVIGLFACLGWRARVATKTVLWFAYCLLPFVLTVASGYVTYRSLPVAFVVPASDRQAAAPLFIHLSDLHFLAPNRLLSTEGRPIDTSQASRLVGLVTRLRPRFLIISGDVTDVGAEEEWRNALDSLLIPVRRAGVSIVMAPGNHDIQPALLLYRGEMPTNDKKWQPIMIEAQVAARFLRNLASLNPSFHNEAGFDVETLMMPWAGNSLDFKLPQEEYRRCLQRAAFSASPGKGIGGLAMLADAMCKISLNQDILDFIHGYRSWFPLVHHDSSAQTTLIILNSNDAVVETIGSNAVGTLGASQLDRLRDILAKVPESTKQCLIVMHHMPVRRAEDVFGFPRGLSYQSVSATQAFEYSAMATRLRDVRRLVREIETVQARKPGLQVYLLCGHFHRRWLGQISSRLRVVEAGPALEAAGGWVGEWDPVAGHLAFY